MSTVKEIKEDVVYIVLGIVFLSALFWTVSANAEMIPTKFIVKKDRQEFPVNTLSDIKPEKNFFDELAVSYVSPNPCGD